MSSDGSVFTSDKFFVQDISCTIQLQVHQWKSYRLKKRKNWNAKASVSESRKDE